MHHHKDLESNRIMVDIRNTSQESKPIIKRMFFNKEIFSLGNILVGVGDTLKIQFGLKKTGTESSDFMPFAMSQYLVTTQGLEKVSTSTSSGDADNELA